MALALSPDRSGADQPLALPREFRGVSLLMTPDEVKRVLKKSGFSFAVRSGVDVTTLPYYYLIVKRPPKGFQSFSYYFYEGRLGFINVEYALHEVPVDFEALLAELKTKYGEPTEMSQEQDPIVKFKDFYYRWHNGETELEVRYGPPGREPITGRWASGAIVWSVWDSQVKEKDRKELEEKAPFLQKRR